MSFCTTMPTSAECNMHSPRVRNVPCIFCRHLEGFDCSLTEDHSPVAIGLEVDPNVVLHSLVVEVLYSC